MKYIKEKAFQLQDFSESVQESSSSGATYYSEVSFYPKVAAKAVSSVYLSIEFIKKKYSYYVLIV